MVKTDHKKFLPLKTQWFHIMLSLAGGDQHGYGIMREVLQSTGGKVHLWPATLYGSIKRLIEAGLIQESSERPEPELDDARRRYYRLTACTGALRKPFLTNSYWPTEMKCCNWAKT